MSPFFRKITSCSTYLPLWPFTSTNQLFSADLFLQQWWNFHSKVPFQTSVFWGAGILARKSPPRLNCEKRDDFMVFSCCKLGVRPVWLSGFIWVRNRPLERNNGFGRIEHCSLTCTFNDEVQLMLWWNIVSVKKMPMGCATYFGATYHRGQDVRNHLEVISQLNKNDAVRWCQIISEKSSNIRRKQTINLHVFFQACSWFQSFWDDIIANLIPIIWPWGLIWTQRKNPKVDASKRQVSATSCWESMWSQSESPEQMSPSPFQPQ